jgi:two-component system chemotaxis response regulator CheB/two-component system response regulator WspF
MRVGIISERAWAAEALSRTIALGSAHEIHWIADSAAAAVSLCAAHTPDVVLMATPFRAIDGVDVTRQIMTGSPCPILIVTESLGVNATFVLDAMGVGALGAVDVPAFDSAHLSKGTSALLAKMDTISRIAGDRSVSGTGKSTLTRHGKGPDGPLVAIGASAGGPAAVATILCALPPDFPAAVVIVQHVGAEFVPGMAAWLSEQSGRRVSVAAEGDRPVVGDVFVAGATGHLTFKSAARLGYAAEPHDAAYCPSVDVFFRSVARLWSGPAIGVVLTGMGKDGAAGLKALREKGHYTIAQDEATSVVYGMPKAAKALHAAVAVLALDRIAGRLVDVVGGAVVRTEK